MQQRKEQTKKEQFLLLRIRAFEDKDAFATLVQEHTGALLRFLHFKLPRREDAEDAYSTVCLQLWDYLTRTEVKNFSGLMFTVARAVIASFYEERSRTTTVPLHDEKGAEIPVASAFTVSDLQAKIDVGLLEEKLRMLTDDERQFIILRHLEGYRVKDIAKQFGLSENTTSVKLSRALQKLRELYERS